MMSSMSTTKSWDKSLSACGETTQTLQPAAPSSSPERRFGTSPWLYLIHHHDLDLIHLCHPLLDQVQDPSWCSNDHMHWWQEKKPWMHSVNTGILLPTSPTSLIQTHDVISQVGAPGSSHDLDSSQVFSYLDGDLADLQGQLTRGNHNQCWNIKIQMMTGTRQLPELRMET